MQTSVGKNLQKLILYIQATRKLTGFFDNAAKSLFYLPQNAVYFIILSFLFNQYITAYTIHYNLNTYPRRITVKGEWEVKTPVYTKYGQKGGTLLYTYSF